MPNSETLINKYLANGGTIKKCPSSKTKYEPIKNKHLIPTSRPMRFDIHGRRKYNYLNKISYQIEADPATRNYGD